nr:hypothetical protein [Tanacetum cinerariifolium]
RSCTSERAKVYYECNEPFKSLKCLWVRSKSIAVTWLKKVVTPLIEPAIEGFADASAVLKLKHLKVDKHVCEGSSTLEDCVLLCETIEFLRTQAAHSKVTDQVIESVHWKCYGEDVGQLVIGLDKVQFNLTLFYVLLDEMVSDRYMFRSGVLNRVAGYGYG